ncbi:TetR/AcrR family transcriptional regulator [Allostreptomyces psammosilenae]|uniref:AcrR family transcriptional regulator n=1 Tax=Allostreptomyces psammosilenae TaxID=1892865 RepID=A0A852ZZ63_9ACTN|nr:TetR/AcrR family transcriptional regulator [Allostreptomyces psammosilenae]NYI07439.1 AcrR family transcriptional regulator [Allostreptomyces psammosilenae]
MDRPMRSRRERLRAETIREIKSHALRQMAEGGPSAISLRAIARDMGMTAGAIYSYYDTRDDLISTLIGDVYTALADGYEAALASVPADDPAGRVLAVGESFRRWAVGHPEEFRLLYGDPAPGYQAPKGAAAVEAEHRACAVITGLVDAAWPRARHHWTDDDYTWDDFDPDFAAVVRATYPDLPPTGVALAMRVWGRMHGLVSLEVYGHIAPQVRDPAKLYRAELLDLMTTLRLTAPDARSA